MMHKYLIPTLLSWSLVCCQTENQDASHLEDVDLAFTSNDLQDTTKIRSEDIESVLIYNDEQDTTTIKYNQVIMELPEYKNWRYNSYSNNQDNVIGHSHFEHRKVVIHDKVYYHLELIRQKYGRPTDSFMHPTETVCYFRIDPVTGEIKILNSTSEVFVPLMNQDGRQLFLQYLSE